MSRGIVIRESNEAIQHAAKRHGLPVTVGEPSLVYERTLLIGDGIAVPWEQVSKGFGFLDTWEAAAPIWAYETLAADVARGAERERAEALIGDLRVPLYSTELLFLRRCENSERLLSLWQADGGGRLAFLRALYEVKPLFLALPRSWLVKAASVAGRTRRNTGSNVRLVHVQIAPGRSVCCRPDEVDMYRQRFAQMAEDRRRR
jgi:hypothetical protein